MDSFLIFVIIFVVLLTGVGVYSVKLQRSGLGAQSNAISRVDESIELQKSAVEMQKVAMKMSEESITLQKETNRLLEQLIAASKK